MLDATNAFTGDMIHASPVPPRPVGRRYIAFCGETVSNVTRVPWSPLGPTRCPGCTATIIRVSRLMEMRGHDTTEFET